MGSKRNVDMSASDTEVKVVEVPAEEQKTKAAAKKVVKQKKQRSKKYVAVRSQVDKSREYDPFSAIELLKKLSYARFDSSICADIQVMETGYKTPLTLPHNTGKTVKVAIASDAVIKKIEAGKIEFDVLLSSKEFMPKLTKFAKILGPKGLMPNPKSGTLTDKPQAKKKELEAGNTIIKTEKKAPLMHVMIGKTSMETKLLVENLQALIKTVKDKTTKLHINATMSPAVRVSVASPQGE